MSGEATQLLRRLGSGDADAGEELARLLERELHALARGAMATLPSGHTLQTTALVNEAWLRLAARQGAPLESRNHFLAVAARAMRSVLVDHARRRGALKRGGGEPRTALDDTLLRYEERAFDLLALDAALEELAQAAPRLAQVVNLRFFAGLENAEVAEVSGSSLRTVERDWRAARAWLHQRLGGS